MAQSMLDFNKTAITIDSLDFLMRALAVKSDSKENERKSFSPWDLASLRHSNATTHKKE